MNLKNICVDVYRIAKEIYGELGGGFNEAVLQNALAIELRERKINYLKEVNIEIFYKGHSIGADRPDFVLLPSKKKSWGLTEPIVLETKVYSGLTKDHRQQLKSYFRSFPHNKNTDLRKVNKGVLLNFLKAEEQLDIRTKKQDERKKAEIMLEFWFYNRRTGQMKLRYNLPLETT